MKVDESTPDEERLELIRAVTADAANVLGLDLEQDSPQTIVKKVNETIVSIVFDESTPVSHDEDPDLLLGCLWGSQIVRQFGWHWADVTIDDSINEIAIVSPKQEMIIFPLSFAGACIQKQCVCTIELGFNMLLENDRIKEATPGSYENIMLNIHHIVPPYTLEHRG